MNNKYGISGIGTVSIWNQENDQGRLGIDNRGKRKNQREIEDIDILKNPMLFWWKSALSNTNKKIRSLVWYNNERIQKKLGYLSPVQYWLKYSN